MEHVKASQNSSPIRGAPNLHALGWWFQRLSPQRGVLRRQGYPAEAAVVVIQAVEAVIPAAVAADRLSRTFVWVRREIRKTIAKFYLAASNHK